VGSLEGSLGKIIVGGFCGNCPGYHHSLNVTQDERNVYYRTLDTAFRLRGFLIYRKNKNSIPTGKSRGGGIYVRARGRECYLRLTQDPIPTESAAFSSNCKL